MSKYSSVSSIIKHTIIKITLLAKCALIMLVLLFSCLSDAHTKELSDDYSQVEVTITGYACTEISKGLVEDEEGNRWYLPDKVFIPSQKGNCPSSTKRQEIASIKVIATAKNPGAINAKARTVNHILTPQLGWTKVTNNNAATPGVSFAEQCQQALRTNKNFEFYHLNSGVQNFIPVYDKDGIIVYIDEKSFLEVANNPYRKGEFNGTFYGTLIFVFKDEKVRLSAIEEIKKHIDIRENFSCQTSKSTPNGTVYTRGLSCAEVQGKSEGKIDNLKYVIMRVVYYKKGVGGLAGIGFIPGPIIDVQKCLYLSPARCTIVRPDLRREDREIIFYNDLGFFDDSVNPTLIYKSLFGFRTTDGHEWQLFFGDIHTLATKSNSLIKMGTDQTLILNEVIKNINDLIIKNINN